jgi:hypothetical protein
MNDKIGIYDNETGEYSTVELTDAEQAKIDAERAAWRIAKDQAVLDAEQLRQTKISAYEKLGLTEAEIEALLPAPAQPII